MLKSIFLQFLNFFFVFISHPQNRFPITFHNLLLSVFFFANGLINKRSNISVVSEHSFSYLYSLDLSHKVAIESLQRSHISTSVTEVLKAEIPHARFF